MSETGLTAEGSTDAMADGLRAAGDELEAISQENSTIADAFEQNGWDGMDRLNKAEDNLNVVRDGLTSVAEKIGAGGAAVRDARLANQMATHASSESLGRT